MPGARSFSPHFGRPRCAGRNEVVDAAIAGDHGALVQLLDAVQPDIRRFARQQCQASDADDAVQEALWLLSRRVGMVRAAAALPAWLWTIVRRACARLARATRLSDARADDLADDLRLSSRPAPELRLDVTAAIASLPPHYREVVLLRDVEEMTVDEIAAALALTREAVKARLHRARVLLREYLLR